MEITELTAAQLRKAADILEQIEAAKGQLHQLLDDAPSPVVAPARTHWTQTPEGKARLAKAVRASWRRRRAL